MLNERIHFVKGVRYVERPAPVRKSREEHICAGCAACDGVRVDFGLCLLLPACAEGAVGEKIVWVEESGEVDHA